MQKSIIKNADLPPAPGWDQYFVSMAYLTAMKSKDRSTKVGAIIVGTDNEIRSTGFCGPCRGMLDTREDIHTRPQKYMYFEHAERNAIYNAARIGVSCKGATMYSTWCPCVDCARAIIQSGITQLVVHMGSNVPDGNPQWVESMNVAKLMLSECGVAYREWQGELVNPQIIINGTIRSNVSEPNIDVL